MMDAITIIAICAAITALAALGVSVWEGIENRRHNRLTTRPNLRIDRWTYVGSPISITVCNNGSGLAIVHGFTVLCDGNFVTAADVPLAVAAVNRLGLNGLFHSYTPEVNDSLAVGESKILLEIIDFPNDANMRRDLRQNLKRINFDIEYKSVYGECFSTKRSTNLIS